MSDGRIEIRKFSHTSRNSESDYIRLHIINSNGSKFAKNIRKIKITTCYCVLDNWKMVFEIDARACESNLDPPDVLHKRSSPWSVVGWKEGEWRNSHRSLER